MSLIGVVGLGLMWGWLLGLFSHPPQKRPFINRLILILLTTLLLGQTAWLNGLAPLLPLVISIGFSFILYQKWINYLHLRRTLR